MSLPGEVSRLRQLGTPHDLQLFLCFLESFFVVVSTPLVLTSILVKVDVSPRESFSYSKLVISCENNFFSSLPQVQLARTYEFCLLLAKYLIALDKLALTCSDLFIGAIPALVSLLWCYNDKNPYGKCLISSDKQLYQFEYFGSPNKSS